MDVEGLIERRFLLVKRGLYYGPNNSGYTGFKERAGRYLESDARPDSGVTAIHEDEADEIAPACFDDLAREYLTGKLAAAAEALSRQKAAGEVMKEIAERLIDQRDEPWPGGTESDRLHYWRDKAISASRDIRATLNSIGADRD